jgi:hypothetical protein
MAESSVGDQESVSAACITAAVVKQPARLINVPAGKATARRWPADHDFSPFLLVCWLAADWWLRTEFGHTGADANVESRSGALLTRMGAQLRLSHPMRALLRTDKRSTHYG